ncbi:MAG: prenyltransferase/squalene oxidase repeat-containing protein [Candidatus Bathyarchaeia archaeon]
MDFEKAVEFVRRVGGKEEVERLECILEDRKPETRFIDELRKLQNTDGGFPLIMEKGKPSTLMDSAVVLVRLDEFNFLQIDIVEKIVNFFFIKQNKDGSWNEDENILPYNPPPWMDPRDDRVKILSTAYTGFWLAKLGYADDKRIRKACDWLINYRRENGAFEGFRHNTWIGISLFAMVYGKRCNVTREGLEFLAEIPRAQWIPSQTTWLLWCLSSANFTHKSKFVKYFLDLLSKSQNPNGSFSSEDGKEFSVSATLEAIKVLKYFSFGTH